MKKNRLAILSALAISTILVSIFTIVVLKPVSSSPMPAATFEYRAKWICNTPSTGFAVINITSAENIGLVGGEYQTDINVHNPSRSVNLTILKEFVVSNPEQSPRFGPVAFARTLLPTEGAIFMNCADIFSTFKNAGIVLCPSANVTCAVKGFVILDQLSPTAPVGTGFSSPNSLDVVAEYSSHSFAPASSTTAPNSCAQNFGTFVEGFSCAPSGNSLDVVPIPASPFVT